MHPNWHPTPYIVHFCWPEPCEPWSKLVQYIGNRVPFGTQSSSLGTARYTMSLSLSSPEHSSILIMLSFHPGSATCHWNMSLLSERKQNVSNVKGWVLLWDCSWQTHPKRRQTESKLALQRALVPWSARANVIKRSLLQSPADSQAGTMRER
jgi:hypothetical protein